MKKIVFVLGLLGLTLGVASCANNNANEFVSLNAYNDVYVEINDDAQKKIEKAYKEKYNKDINWCMPDENVNSFKNIESLNDYVESNIGFRLYGKYENSYVICEYQHPITVAAYYSLNYDDIELLNNIVGFNVSYFKTYIYSEGKIEEYQANVLNANLYNYTQITQEEALEIKANNEKYNEKYFNKFMTEEDSSLLEAYQRIYNELKINSNNIDEPDATETRFH